MSKKIGENEKQRKMLVELASLEENYRASVRHNPTSINATQDHLQNIEKIVSRMKRIRNSKTVNRPVRDNSFLTELLYPKEVP